MLPLGVDTKSAKLQQELSDDLQRKHHCFSSDEVGTVIQVRFHFVVDTDRLQNARATAGDNYRESLSLLFRSVLRRH